MFIKLPLIVPYNFTQFDLYNKVSDMPFLRYRLQHHSFNVSTAPYKTNSQTQQSTSLTIANSQTFTISTYQQNKANAI